MAADADAVPGIAEGWSKEGDMSVEAGPAACLGASGESACRTCVWKRGGDGRLADIGDSSFKLKVAGGGERNGLLDTELGIPSPEIAGPRERGNRDGGE